MLHKLVYGRTFKHALTASSTKGICQGRFPRADVMAEVSQRPPPVPPN
jgi:hypothetical protein